MPSSATDVSPRSFVRAATLEQVRKAGCLAVTVGGHTLVLVAHEGRVFALDNRCPHMGFPLDRGDVAGGILTCQWHHARFDLASGGTFDLWADDVRTFPVEIRGEDVWVDVAPRRDEGRHHRRRLRRGLERNIPLVIAKSVLAMSEGDEDAAEVFRAALEFGVRHRHGGWGRGLTMLTCFANLLEWAGAEDRLRALYHGVAAVAADSHGVAPRFPVEPLPGVTSDPAVLKRWFRQFVELRDAEGAERCLVSTVRAGAGPRRVADMLFAAATDHRYISTGHVADFTNKALEALDRAGWELAGPVLGSLVAGYAAADRMEESVAWRTPVDLVAILERAFDRLPGALESGATRREAGARWAGRDELVQIVLADDPGQTTDALLAALGEGAHPAALAGAVAYAAATRIARFDTSNEFTDWDTALHTFTFANAMQLAVRRVDSPEVLRGVFDAAMSVYLDRFLNIPPAPVPAPGPAADAAAIAARLGSTFDRRQQVDEAGRDVVTYLANGGRPEPLLAAMAHALLREDRDFHTIQMIEAAFRQHALVERSEERALMLVAAARYLAAHTPTVRAQEQTFEIARRLHRGEHLFERARA